MSATAQLQHARSRRALDVEFNQMALCAPADIRYHHAAWPHTPIRPMPPWRPSVSVTVTALALAVGASIVGQYCV